MHVSFWVLERQRVMAKAANRSNLRKQLLRIQREHYERNARLVKQSLTPNKAVSKYGREYARYLKNYEAIASKAELIKNVLASDIVYHGDYHPLRHSQRAILAVLEQIADKRKIILCLEMFHATDQNRLDQYLRGELDEKTFLQKIDYAGKWAYNFNPWRHILNFCRANNIAVLGINRAVENGEDSLLQRDIFSAQIIGKACIANPEALVYVIDGDYHISPNHLPLQVESRVAPLGVTLKRTIIYQNAENLFWKLAEEGLEEADVLQIRADAFCLMNTMPANKSQSYLHWLEYAEEGYYPVKGHWAELSGENYFLVLQSLIQDLDSIFTLNFPMSALDRLTVYSSRNLDFMEIIQDTPELRKSLRQVKSKIKLDEGFLLDYLRGKSHSYIIYLPNSSINMAAEEATHFIHAVLRGPNKTVSGFDYFYRNLLTEALGFFGSKLINEKRKAPSETALKVWLGRLRKGVDFISKKEATRFENTARLMLQHFHLERRQATEIDFRKKFMEIYSEKNPQAQILSTQMGYALGNKLYEAVKKGLIPLKEIRQLFFEKMDVSGHAFTRYLEFNEKLKPKRSSSKENLPSLPKKAA